MPGASTLLILIAVLGGYLSLNYSYPFRYRAQRLTGYRLLFESAFGGVLLLLVARIACYHLSQSWPQLREYWRRYVPLDLAGTAVGALLLGAGLTIVVNWFLRSGLLTNVRWANPDYYHVRAITRHGTTLEQTLLESFQEDKPLSITLKNDKVYVGYPVETFEPQSPREYFELLPTASGHREPDSRELKLTTYYTKAYEFLEHKGETDNRTEDEYSSGEGTEARIRDLRVILPVAEVYTVTFFDDDVYDLLRRRADSEETPWWLLFARLVLRLLGSRRPE